MLRASWAGLCLSCRTVVGSKCYNRPAHVSHRHLTQRLAHERDSHRTSAPGQANFGHDVETYPPPVRAPPPQIPEWARDVVPMLTGDIDHATLVEVCTKKPARQGRVFQRTEPSYPYGHPLRQIPVKSVPTTKHFAPTLKTFRQRAQQLADLIDKPGAPPEFAKLKPLKNFILQLPEIVYELLLVLGGNSDYERVWSAHVSLTDLISHNKFVNLHLPSVPPPYLYRTFRVIARRRPKTLKKGLRLLSIATYIRHTGHKLDSFIWEQLIDHVGAGLRKPGRYELTKAWDLFNDMREGRIPASRQLSFALNERTEPDPVQPSITTLIALLNLAVKTGDRHSITKVFALMNEYKFTPNRIFHLIMLKHFTKTKNMHGFRKVLVEMYHWAQPLGLDGLNACIWAFGRVGRLDLVLSIYRLLRHNHHVSRNSGEHLPSDEVVGIQGDLEVECIIVDPEIIPNQITYIATAQIAAYVGDFEVAVMVFQDMLSTPNMESGARMSDTKPHRPLLYLPILPMYRAMFIGFAKHGMPPSEGDSPWNLDNFKHFLDLFLDLPRHTRPSRSTVHVVLQACDVVSGGDQALVRDVWRRMDGHFGVGDMPNLQSRTKKWVEELESVDDLGGALEDNEGGEVGARHWPSRGERVERVEDDDEHGSRGCEE